MNVERSCGRQPSLSRSSWAIRLLGFLLPLLSLQPATTLGSSLLVNFDSSDIRVGGSPLGIGASLFVVSPVSPEQDFYSALGAINSGAELASFFSNTNQLRYFNLADPVNYGSDNGGDVDLGTFRGWPEGGAAWVETSSNTVARRLFLLISSSTNQVFDATTQFLLLRSRVTPNTIDAGVPLDTVDTPFNAEVSRDLSFGVDVIFGEMSGTNTFGLSGAAGTSRITSSLAQTNTAGTSLFYQILANNGADRFFATTNTSGMNLMETNLPAGFSVSTNTGVITVATNASAGTYAIRLVASNSLTASIATNTLTWVLQAATLSFTTTTNLISATAGVEISPFTFVSTGTAPTYSVGSGDLRGLSLSSAGVLSGIPTSTGTNNVSIQASAGGQSASTTFSLAVAAPTISVPADQLSGGQLVATSGIARTIVLSNTAGFTNLSGLISPARTGVSFNGTNLIIATNALPLAKGTTNVTLTLTASRAVGGSTVSNSTTVPLRIIAPTPSAFTGSNVFEVPVGDNFSLQLETDLSSILTQQEITAIDPLPPGIQIRRETGNLRFTGLISGINRSTNLPNEYQTRFVADTSTFYEGGGRLTSPPVTFLLRNYPPVFTSTNRIFGAAQHRELSYVLETTNSSHVDSEILGSLPPGLVAKKRGKDVELVGTPAMPGLYTNTLVARNYLRPGDTNGLQETTMALVIRVFGTDTPVRQPVASASFTNLRVGIPISHTPPLRLTSSSLPEGTYVVANSPSFTPISFPLPEVRYEFLPGILLDPFTGIVSGTPGRVGTFQVTISFMNARKIEKTNLVIRVQ